MNPPSGRPLAGVRVVVTRAKEQSGEFIGMLEEAGAEVVSLPSIETVPPGDSSGLDRAIRGIGSYDYAVFTSANALKFLIKRMRELGKGPEELKGAKIVAVGPKTAKALEARGLKADIVPSEFKAEGVVKALSCEDIKGKKILYPRAEAAREVLPDALKEAGAEVDLVTAYRTVVPEGLSGLIKDALTGDKPTVVTFASSSAVRNFLNAAGPEAGGAAKAGGVWGILSGAAVACIGPVTARTCEEAGLKVSVVPKDYTAEGLFEAIVGYVKKEKCNA